MNLETALSLYIAASEKRGVSPAHLKTIRWRLGPFCKTFPGRTIHEFAKGDLMDYFIGLKRKGLAEATLAGHSSTHKAFWKWLKKRGVITKNPAKGLKKWSYKPVRNKAATKVRPLPGALR